MDGLGYKVFKSRPTNLLVAEVREHIKKTGQPEILSTLYRDRIAKDERFEILAEIDVNRKLRPEGDLAPCPMCQPNKFTNGRLCWFPRLKCLAFIGHCCADKEIARIAKSQFEAETRLKADEDFLLSTLPLIPEKQRVLDMLWPAVDEALRVYRQFRKDAPFIHKQLRQVATANCRFILTEHISTALRAAGVSGIRGQEGSIQTREISFGPLSGDIITRANFNPMKEFDRISKTLTAFDVGANEEDIIDFIVSLNEASRKNCVVQLRECDRSFHKLQDRLGNFVEFFAPENLDRLKAWGDHELNPIPIRVKYWQRRDRRIVSLSNDVCEVVLAPATVLWKFQINWPRPSAI